jgi:hypothetical protein
MSAGRSASTAIAGSPQAIALDQHLAELLAHRRQHDHVAGGEDVRQLAGARASRRGRRPRRRGGDRRPRVLALPLAGKPPTSTSGRAAVEAGRARA